MTESRSEPLCAHVPLPLFASVMGIAGLGLVWRAAEEAWGLAPVVSVAATVAAAVVFVVLLALYVCKSVRYRSRVMVELAHPVRINFLPTLSINLILLGILSRPWLGPVSDGLWQAGALLQLILTIVIVNVWFEAERPADSINPAWFIPAVGNVLVPLAAIPSGQELVAWFFMSIGLFFWVILGTMVFYRLVTKPPMQPPMQPTLVVMLAPPSVAFLSWLQIAGELNGPGYFFYAVALLTFLVLLPQLPRFFRLPFFPSWWAYTFPLAAFTVSSLAFVEQYGLEPGAIQIGLVALTTAVILLVAGRTIVAVARGEMSKH
ncbi:SLAC1 anion channel family protein [Wenzhouxiangella sp. AB-CW3]|uniref:SLAC1 anion channel family protein n=1 Tax=Wenzhouxiangella sp. AB-CW3 TaxID=2771012 RepID=UPI00168B2DA3|nr:SLAC1 anion channel family protein [Wenzhouxiangella sp. AB-CW3]QOC23465.1 SLAC1 anion channel family protein [Wenzhouxiangella sp. AB-CW3]